VSGSDVPPLPGDLAVPSHGNLFDEPGESPALVPARLGQDESLARAVASSGRLYRSAGAEGDVAAAAIPALSRPPTIDPALPLSPEAVAAAALAPSAVEAVDAVDAADAVDAVDGVEASEAPAVEPTSMPDAAPEAAPEAASEELAVLAAASVIAEAAAVTPPLDTPPIVSAPIVSAPIAPATPWTAIPIIAPSAGTPAPPEAPAAEVPAIPTVETGLTWSRASALIVGGTVVAAFLDALLRDGIGVITGVALVLTSAAAALTLRRSDIWAAVVMPPLAFLAALLTAGQLTVSSSGSLLSRQALNIVTGLSLNAPWLIAATLIALVIVMVRRRRTPLVRPAIAPTPDAVPEPSDAPVAPAV